MTIYNLFDIPGTEFPAGRRTRVMVGPGAPAEADGFVIGHVTIYPGGAVPLHCHEQEEVYVIVRGEGALQFGEEIQAVKPGSYIYLSPHTAHSLTNTSADEEMIMLFCYAPKSIVEHWRQELEEVRP